MYNYAYFGYTSCCFVWLCNVYVLDDVLSLSMLLNDNYNNTIQFYKLRYMK